MSKVIIRRPVSVVAIMTEKFREQMIREAEKTLQKIEGDTKKIETEAVKYISSISLQNPDQGAALTQQMEAEKERLKSTREQLEARIGEFETVEVGKEVTFQTFDGFAEIQLGDNLLDRINKTVVVMKDWVVTEIREA